MRDYYGKHTDWYWQRYYELTTITRTYKEAWQQVEEEHYNKFEFYKYEEYGTFRVEKCKRQERLS